MNSKDIQFVDRSKIRSSRKRSSKFSELLKALDQLDPNGKAIEVSYKNDKEVNSMRTAVYQYNKNNGVKIRSNKDSQNKNIYFYREK